MNRAKQIEVDLGDETHEVDGTWAVQQLDEASSMLEVLRDSVNGIKPDAVTEAQLQTARIMLEQIDRRVFGGLQYLSKAFDYRP